MHSTTWPDLAEAVKSFVPLPSLADKFVAESNRIEGITRPPTEEELEEFDRFMELPEVTVEELERFVKVYQPNARLRDKVGLNVRVGNHLPPPGGPNIRKQLQAILERVNGVGKPFDVHVDYEMLHPFTDGNGRSGRMLWVWQLGEVPRIGFLHLFYYQCLSSNQTR